MELKDFLNSKNIALYIQKLPEETTLDKALFPDDKQMSMEIENAKGADGRVQVLKVSQFDVAAKLRALNASLDLEKMEMPFFKEAIRINEKDRRDLIQAMNSNNQNLVDMLVKKVWNNINELVEGSEAQFRRMRAQVIQNGAINITTDEGDIVVDYGIPATHKETITSADDVWTNPEADILGDIERYQKVFTDAGLQKPTRLVMTETTFNKTIMKNNAIALDYSVRYLKDNQAEARLTKKEIVSYLKDKYELSVAFVDGQIVNEAGSTVSLYEDGKVSLIPTGTLGRTVYSPTPEEYDKLYGTGKLDTEVVRTGVAITTMVQDDPVTVDTKVSSMGLPSFDKANNVFLATVYSA